jgi:hypothetical protein
MNKTLASVLLFAGSVAVVNAKSSYTISPTSISFANTTVGMRSDNKGVRITNTGGSAITVDSVSVSPAVFQITQGVTPRMITAGRVYSYDVQFVPTSAGTFTGALILVIDGTPVSVPLSGTALSTSAIATVGPTSITFSNRPLGTNSKYQNFTITNTGASNLNIESISTQPPFTLSSFATPTLLTPGKAVTAGVSFFGSAVGSHTGNITVTYDVLPPTGISLSGTTLGPTAFGIATYPTLPFGTAGAAYYAVLQPAGGVAPVTWAVVSGHMPPGLSLSPSGVISGDILSIAEIATYQFSVQATDSNKPASTVNAGLNIQVLNPTGASCNNITFDIANTSSPLVPITDLGRGNYFGTMGGLYPGGTNVAPTSHVSDGVAFAQRIQALDALGHPDPNGKYVLLGVGISTLQYEMNVFVPMASADPALNSKLVIVNGAQASASATDFADPASPFWATITNLLLPDWNVTANQVVAVLFEDVDNNLTGTYPSDNTQLQGELESIAQNIHNLFPNVKLMYFEPRVYGGYSNGISNANPEPYAYEVGFAMQKVVADQLAGLSSLNYDPSKGPVMAPWISWGTYDWANGMLPRGDGLVYTCQDMLPDGRHPSPNYGAPKVASIWLDFFKTDPTTTPWFLAH